MKNKNCIAMLLAGGQGSRLYNLTSKIAKPAVSFGGKYRIIDFPLSNCLHSGIDTVGVLTQYQPLILNDYIGNGQPWDLDRNFGGVHVLPPYQGKKGSNWYKGTANAIYQNLHFVKSYNPNYVLILSGDHIYKMDYSLLLDYHIAKSADCTIAVMEVPIDEASRFGILSSDNSGRITDFEEKPKKPKSTKASMGIYIFSVDKLVDYLCEDEKTEGSANDFGKDIIPKMLSSGEKMFAYTFSGYWKDVGTIDSLWEANMDLLGSRPDFNIYDENWRIHCRSRNAAPFYADKTSFIENSIVCAGSEIKGTVINSIIGSGVTVSEGAVIKDSVIMANVYVGNGTKVTYSIIDEDAVIGGKAVIGGVKDGKNKIAVIGMGYNVKDGETVLPGELPELV